MTYPSVIRWTALLFAALCVGLLLAPQLFVLAFNLDPSVGAEVMARRAGMLFAGLAPLYLSLAGLADPRHQHGVLRASLVMMAGLALLGLGELFMGRVGPGVLIPVVLEIGFSGLYAILMLRRPA
ncbi:MAG: hypothetical protein U1E58_05575 [Tabrizicola sp.]